MLKLDTCEIDSGIRGLERQGVTPQEWRCLYDPKCARFVAKVLNDFRSRQGKAESDWEVVMATEEHHHRHTLHGGHHSQGHGHEHHTYDASNLLCADAFYGATYQQIIGWLEVMPGSRVLEAGSGAGGVTELLAEAVGADGTVVALDVTPELLQTVQERMVRSPFKDRVSYHEGNIQHLPFEDRQFDLVWSSRTIHHLSEQLAGVKELCRVLKPGGRLALREGGLRPRFLPNDLGIGDPGLEERLELAFQRWFQSYVRGGEGHVRYPYGWTQLLRDAGLQNVSARTFLLELLPAFNSVQVEYMTGLLERWVTSNERRPFISDEDADAIRQLIAAESPRYAFHRRDLHYLEGVTVYVGEV
jgi:ubiquinone/menaquinone biosynthesis C-methylase UbiE